MTTVARIIGLLLALSVPIGLAVVITYQHGWLFMLVWLALSVLAIFCTVLGGMILTMASDWEEIKREIEQDRQWEKRTGKKRQVDDHWSNPISDFLERRLFPPRAED